MKQLFPHGIPLVVQFSPHKKKLKQVRHTWFRFVFNTLLRTYFLISLQNPLSFKNVLIFQRKKKSLFKKQKQNWIVTSCILEGTMPLCKKVQFAPFTHLPRAKYLHGRLYASPVDIIPKQSFFFLPWNFREFLSSSCLWKRKVKRFFDGGKKKYLGVKDRKGLAELGAFAISHCSVGWNPRQFRHPHQKLFSIFLGKKIKK